MKKLLLLLLLCGCSVEDEYNDVDLGKEVLLRPGVWLSEPEIMTLPTSGPAWSNLVAEANQTSPLPNISNQDDNTDVKVMAKALVAVRTNNSSMKDEVRTKIMQAMETENGGRTLALGRNLIAYVIAADLVKLTGQDDINFRTWLSGVRNETLDGKTLISTHEERPNNWGTHAGASRIAADIYLGDQTDFLRAGKTFAGWMGYRNIYAGFDYGDLSWQSNPSQPVGINPIGALIQGHNVDGVLPDDQRRQGAFTWPPAKENYVYEALQGAVAQAWMLYHQGYQSFQWKGRALLRAYNWLHTPHFIGGTAFPAEGDDEWQPWIINKMYGTTFPTHNPARPGKNVGWSDWTHQ